MFSLGKIFVVLFSSISHITYTSHQANSLTFSSNQLFYKSISKKTQKTLHVCHTLLNKGDENEVKEMNVLVLEILWMSETKIFCFNIQQEKLQNFLKVMENVMKNRNSLKNELNGWPL